MTKYIVKVAATWKLTLTNWAGVWKGESHLTIHNVTLSAVKYMPTFHG